MKIVLHHGELVLLNASNNIILTYLPLNSLSDIFLPQQGWKTSTKEKLHPRVGTDLIYDNDFSIRSFKDLKHNVAAYLIKHDDATNVPNAYKNAYNCNKHLYNGRYED